MDLLLQDSLRAAHLIGLALGFGPALLADGMALRSVFVPVARQDLVALPLLHRVILVGLAVLWVSGLGLIWLRTGFVAENFTPKLILKIVVVVTLTLNAGLIGCFAMPRFAAGEGLRLGAFEPGDRFCLTMIGGLSLTCWLSALALGAFGQLKPLSYDMLQMIFAPLFLAGLVGAMSIGAGAAYLVQAEARPKRQGTGRVGPDLPEVIYL